MVGIRLIEGFAAAIQPQGLRKLKPRFNGFKALLDALIAGG